MADNFTPIQAQKMKLAGSGCTASATSIILQSLVLPGGSTAITMADFGDIGYATIEPGSGREEQISFTGITSNTLTGVTRGLRFVAPYDEVTANKFAHAGGSILVFSNTAAFYSELSSRDNDETITGLYTFTQFPQKSGSTTPTAANELATKEYVDNVVGGSALYDQNVVSGVAGETLAAGNLIYFKTADGRWWLTDGNTAATIEGVIIGFAQGTAAAGAAINVVIGGIDKNQSGLTAGTTYYASDTNGALSASAGTTERIVGKAITTTSIILDQNFAVSPKATEKAALAGSSGTPSGSNKYVTTADTKYTHAVLQNGTAIYAADAEANDTYVITLSPVPAAYTNGMVVNFKANTANTGAATLNVNGLGPITIKKLHDQDLATGDIEAGQIVSVVYDGTNFQMQSQTAQVKADLVYLTASDTLQFSDDTEEQTDSDAYTKLKELYVLQTGTYRVKFDQKNSDATFPGAYARIYKDDVAYGSERNNDTAAYVTYSEDLYFKTGDKISIYAKQTNGTAGKYSVVTNFRLYFTENVTSAKAVLVS